MKEIKMSPIKKYDEISMAQRINLWKNRLNQIAHEMEKYGHFTDAEHLDFIVDDLDATLKILRTQ